MVTMTCGSVSWRFTSIPVSGIPKLNRFDPEPTACTLCSVSSPLRKATGCPARTPRTLGTNSQPRWSTTTGSPGIG